MPLEYSAESYTFRADAGVLETFLKGTSEQRVLLSQLAVQVFPVGRNNLAIHIGSAPPGVPLYEALPKARPIKGRGSCLQLSVASETEPALREFFTQVALLCDRPLPPA